MGTLGAMEKIVIFGSGGHASVIIDLLEKMKTLKIEAVIVSPGDHAANFCGYPTIPEPDFLSAPIANVGIVGVGDNFLREKIASQVNQTIPGFQWATLVHPSATIGKNVQLGSGAVVMAGAILQINSILGKHCLVNTGAILDHDTSLGDYSSVAPGAVLGGRASLGRSSAVGLGAHVHHSVSIGEHSIVGGASLVNQNIPANVVAFGVPCKVIRERKVGEPYLT
jgi:sugar O-acyltransferase (sialic acid O-acetyltransferase NeuD family)